MSDDFKGYLLSIGACLVGAAVLVGIDEVKQRKRAAALPPPAASVTLPDGTACPSGLWDLRTGTCAKVIRFQDLPQ
jgi:hypothetical protein